MLMMMTMIIINKSNNKYTENGQYVFYLLVIYCEKETRRIPLFYTSSGKKKKTDKLWLQYESQHCVLT